MKKIICMLLVCVLCVTALGGCVVDLKEPLTVEDFYVYDRDGKITEEFQEYMDNLGSSSGTAFMMKGERTYRGIKEGDHAEDVLEKYPIEFFKVTDGVLEEEQQEIVDSYNGNVRRMLADAEKIPFFGIEVHVWVDKEGKCHVYSGSTGDIADNEEAVSTWMLSFFFKEDEIRSVAIVLTPDAQGYIHDFWKNRTYK